jgi:methylthioribose-1-phosphate isomerase
MNPPDVLAWRDGRIAALDQTALPHQVRVLDIGTVDDLVEAITTLAIRGAPVLGAAGALGVALAVRQASRSGWDGPRLDAEIKRIADARPTAVNLRREVIAVASHLPQGGAAVDAAAQAVLESTTEASVALSHRGAAYLRDVCGPGPLRVHTHCNTGALACLGWGSALGVIRALHEAGALDSVIVDETRPLLQGARLTCWELGLLGISHRPTGGPPTATWLTRSAPTAWRWPRTGPVSRSWSRHPSRPSTRAHRTARRSRSSCAPRRRSPSRPRPRAPAR